MTRSFKAPVFHGLLACALGLSLSAPLQAGVNGFQLVNQTGSTIGGVALRRVGGGDWMPLGVAPASGAGSRAAFADVDCAFDLRATVAGAGEVIWSGLNLCDVKSVTLNRDRAGRAWVDYD